MTGPQGSMLGHKVRKLKQLLAAGSAGLPEAQWAQSERVVPEMLAAGEIAVEERIEAVRYLVITAAGRKLLEE